MSYSFDQTDIKYMYLALFYKTAYLSAMSRLIRSDYTELLQNALPRPLVFLDKFSRQKNAF